MCLALSAPDGLWHGHNAVLSFLLALVLPVATVRQACAPQTVRADVLYGVPAHGCCHYASASSVICDPAGETEADTEAATEICKSLVQATGGISEVASLASWTDCSAWCARDFRCLVWSLVPARREYDLSWQPKVCWIIDKPLICKPAACNAQGAFSGQRDCGVNYLTQQPPHNAPLGDINFCDASSPIPETAGMIVDGQFKPQSGCEYRLWDKSDVLTCLAGSWTVIMGSSNALLLAIRLANLVVDQALLQTRDNATLGATSVIDLVIIGGRVVYLQSINLPDFDTIAYSEGDTLDRSYRLAAVLGRAPPISPGAIRITYFATRFWDQARSALWAVRQNQVWLGVPMGILVMLSEWYIMCNVWKLWFCVRPSYKRLPHQEMMAQFRTDMQATLRDMSQMCNLQGTAAWRGCYVATMTWSWWAHYGGHAATYKEYNAVIREEMAPRISPLLRLIDVWELGRSMPFQDPPAERSCATAQVPLRNSCKLLSGADEDLGHIQS